VEWPLQLARQPALRDCVGIALRWADSPEQIAGATGAGTWSGHHQPMGHFYRFIYHRAAQRLTGIACCPPQRDEGTVHDAAPQLTNNGVSFIDAPPRSKAAGAAHWEADFNAVRPMRPGVAGSPRTTNPLSMFSTPSLEQAVLTARTIARPTRQTSQDTQNHHLR